MNKCEKTIVTGGVYMILFISSLAFFMFLFLGRVLLFLNEDFYMLLLLYVLYLFLLKFFITKGNCSPIQIHDYFYVGIFVLLCVFFLYHRQEIFTLVSIAYLYMSAFISMMLYIDTLRYKSLF